LSKPVIGLTGPTGAGKSTVAAALESLGCRVVDADRIAREVVAQPDCLSALQAEFGADIRNPDGGLNRALLSMRAFSDPGKTARLNEITHPRILDEVRRLITDGQTGGAKAIVLDAPLLFESEADRLCDASIAVTAPRELRLSRVMRRDSISRILAEARAGAQHDDSYFHERADYIFDGSLPLELIPDAARELLKKIFGDLHETF
jgi:dephospho-CoA kinase